VKQTIADNADVKTFVKQFDAAFATLPAYLKAELIEKMQTLNIQQQENRISDDIFKRLTSILLIDEYRAYQLLYDEWVRTATDLEIIQTEGIEATRKVDPNMVTKKKDGKDEEMQDGWMGRVIPFELVQRTLLSTQYNELKQCEAELENVLSQYDDLLEKLIEVDDSSEALNDDNTAFVAKEIAKQAKALAKDKKNYPEDSPEYIVLRVDELMANEKRLKKAVKDQAAALHTLTKTTIESLSDNDVLMLLELKWIKPLCDALSQLPNGIINDLVAKAKALAEKYAVTYMDIDREIRAAEQSLSLLIDDLEGNDFDMLGLKELQTLLGAKDDE
jgi:type I restriction enzyme M protein